MQDVDPAEAADDRFDHVAHLGLEGNIARHRKRLPALILDLRRYAPCGIAVDVDNRHLRSMPGEHARRFGAQSVSGAGQDGDPAFQFLVMHLAVSVR